MSFRRIFTMLTCTALACCIGLASAQQSQRTQRNTLPEIGVVASDTISIDKEILIGNVIMRQMRSRAPLVNDPVLDEYIQDLGNRLVIHAENVKFPFTFFIIDNADINALAFYGGHIGIHTGLIFNADNESEVASVLAHEIAHVTQRHLARRMQSAQRSSPIQVASMIGGILLGVASGNAQAGMAAVSASQAAAAQMQINYTRSNEQEADRLGITMLARAGFDPEAAGTFFSKLAAQFRLVSRPPARLLTHPLPETRIADARNRAASMPVRHVPSSLAFQLAKARITARYIYDSKYSLEYYQSLMKNNGPIEPAVKYGYSLALLRNGKVNEAKEHIDMLLKDDSSNNFYIDTHTDILIELNKTDDAIKMLKAKLVKAPRNAVITLNLANAAIKNAEYALATDILRDFLLLNPNHFLSHQLLADAYGNSKQYLEMHQTNAEMYALAAAFPRAIDELQHAYNFTGDSHLEKQRIRARIQQLRDEQAKLERLL